MQLSALQPKDPVFLIVPSVELFSHRLTEDTRSCINPGRSRAIHTLSPSLLKLLSNAGDDPKRGGRTVQAGYRQHEFRPAPKRQQTVRRVLAAMVPSLLPAPRVPVIACTSSALFFLSRFSGSNVENYWERRDRDQKARTAGTSGEGQSRLPEEQVRALLHTLTLTSTQ